MLRVSRWFRSYGYAEVLDDLVIGAYPVDQTDVSGRYEIRIGPPLARESSFAANTDPAESDLAKLDRAALAELLPGWNFLYLTNSRELTTRCTGSSGSTAQG